MKKLDKVDSLAAFAKAYDSGGYFWSPFTRAGDGEITAGEIAMQAARVTADPVAFLQLEMHLDGLRPAEHEEALRMLDPAMRARRERSVPGRTTPSGFERDVAPLKTAIVTGIAEPLDRPAEFSSGLQMLAPTLGTPVPVWIIAGARFNVWRLRETTGPGGAETLVASEGRQTSLPGGKIRVGGMALEAKSKQVAWTGKFLLAHFYMEA